MPRLISFDIAKALCIILVVIGHYNPANSPQWYEIFRKWIYLFHMPFFMFASGYIYMLSSKDETYLAFIKKKTRRLLIPYFAVSVIVISIKLIAQRFMYVESPVTVCSYIRMFYLPEAGMYLRFIWSLFMIFLIVPFFKTKLARLFLLVVSAVLHYAPIEITPIFSLYYFFYMLVYFAFGLFCADWGLFEIRFYLKDWKAYGCYFLLTACFVVFSVLYFHNGWMGGRYFLPWLGIAVVMALSTTISKYGKGPVLKVIMMISSSSYVIYLFHTTFEGFAKAILQSFFVFNVGDSFFFALSMTFVVICGIVFPLCLHRFVLQRCGFFRFMFGLK